MTKYSFRIYDILVGFANKMPQDIRDQLQALIGKEKLMMRSALQTALDVADMAKSMVTAVIMRYLLWLASLRILKEVETIVEDLLFECYKLFSVKTSDSLHLLKDSQAMLQLLGIYKAKP